MSVNDSTLGVDTGSESAPKLQFCAVDWLIISKMATLEV